MFCQFDSILRYLGRFRCNPVHRSKCTVSTVRSSVYDAGHSGPSPHRSHMLHAQVRHTVALAPVSSCRDCEHQHGNVDLVKPSSCETIGRWEAPSVLIIGGVRDKTQPAFPRSHAGCDLEDRSLSHALLARHTSALTEEDLCCILSHELGIPRLDQLEALEPTVKPGRMSIKRGCVKVVRAAPPHTAIDLFPRSLPYLSK